MEIEHGTLSGYAHYRCRCPECCEASRVYNNRRYRLKAYGRWPERTPAGPVREHVLDLMAQGMSCEQIADAAGVSSARVSYAAYGRSGVPARSLDPGDAERMLAVRMTVDRLYRASSVGATRRLQALVAIGYPVRRLARLSGLVEGVLHRVLAGRPANRESRARIRTLYETLCMTPWEPETSWERSASTRARKTAQARSWAPPLAWDDIDDPNEVPQGVAA